MMIYAVWVAVGLLLVNLAVMVRLMLRMGRLEMPALPIEPIVQNQKEGQERTERLVREEIARNRTETGEGSRKMREELGSSINSFAEVVVRQVGQTSTLQKGQLDTFARQLGILTQSNEAKLESVRQTVETGLARLAQDAVDTAAKSRTEDKTNFDAFCQLLVGRITELAVQQKQELVAFQMALKTLTDSNNQNLSSIRDTLERKLGHMQAEATQSSAANREELTRNSTALSAGLLAQIRQMADVQMQQLAKFEAAIGTLTTSNEQKLETVRQTVEGRLTAMQADNAEKLEQMRATVDEKLHATLETRLGESFKLVSDRLEQVHKGLGEMQSLASGVGDLKKVLTNIKTRGTWGEVSLGNLLEQLFTPDQFARNVQVNPQTMDRVEYAIRLPGREGPDTQVWLPIDAKFPEADYQRLVDAAEAGDAETVAACSASLEAQICGEAKKISEKYINPPNTTDFAIMFLPTEGLYAEVLRRPGLCSGLQLDHRVLLAGPTTLSAVLSSLQMGFRTLAIEKRSSEVWQVLGGVKTEFSRFGDVLDKVHKKLQEATNTVESAQTRKRAVERRLKGVEDLPVDGSMSVKALATPDLLQPLGSAEMSEPVDIEK